MRNFMELIRARWSEGKFVCVGLDTDIKKIPTCVPRGVVLEKGPMLRFNEAIIDATKDLVCAYKPNSAFYEALGIPGLMTLQATCEYIREVAPEVPIILDAKRGDIGNTNQGYVTFLFDILGADATTIHPYLGAEAMKPFLDREDKGIFVLCRTSNPGAGEFQGSVVQSSGASETIHRQYLYEKVAGKVRSDWDKDGAAQCGLVVGATYPKELATVREIARDLPILIPGVGAQGGDLEAAVKAGADSDGEGFIINSSRGIIFASDGKDFAEAAATATTTLTDEINEHRLVAA